MKLWLLRHGQAEPQVSTDAERALTERGWREAKDSAERLIGRPIKAILVSPYRRAQETAQQVCKSLNYQGPLETVDWIIPDASAEDALRHLDTRTEDELLLVTHQNFVGELGCLLVEGHTGDSLPLATGSLAELEGVAMAAGLMQLRSLYHPEGSPH